MMLVRTLLSLLLFLSVIANAGQSSITEAQGSACKAGTMDARQTESTALLDAKRNAIEYAKTYISVQTLVENFALKSDVIKSFSDAEVRVLKVLAKSWDDKQQCYSISIRAEVMPVASRLNQSSVQSQLMDDPTAPLTVKIWTNQAEYQAGEYMQIYIKGNKPFYGRLLYKDASGNLLQVLPNPSRTSNYFNGAVVYQVPGKDDAFELLIAPPFGEESLTLYASTAPLGDIEKKNIGAVYAVTESAEKVSLKTRGISFAKVKRNADGTLKKKHQVIEFAETSAETRIKE